MNEVVVLLLYVRLIFRLFVWMLMLKELMLKV